LAQAGEPYVNNLPWLGSTRASIINSPFQMIQASRKAKVVASVGSTDLNQKATYPGVVTHRYGKGRAVYIAPRFGEMYARYPYPMWQRVLRKALEFVTPRRPDVEVNAPQCVTAYTWNQAAENRWVVHLVNDLDEIGRARGRMGAGKNQEPGSAPRTRIIPVEGIDLIVRKPGATRAWMPLEGKELPVRRIKDGIKVRLRRMAQHAMIVIQ
jgi:hypothetical protein